MVYTHPASVTAASGSASSTTLKVKSGLMQQLLIRSATDSTVFRADVTEVGGVAVRHYGYHTGEINDVGAHLPLAGDYTVNITNASANDTFTIRLVVEEV